nr:hypothetical protein [Tanacetum cinerariifolium]GEV28118.1 hypothetical protein [Tanacetum cinerariifolium]
MADAKEMWEAIKSRFGGNDESKKMQKYLLKQQSEGFSVSTSEGLHKEYDRFQGDAGTMETKLETMAEDLHIRMIQKLWLPLMERILTGLDMLRKILRTMLKKLYDEQRDKVGDASVEIAAYTLALKKTVFMNKECDLEDTPVIDRYAKGMHAVPPLMTGNYIPYGPDVEIDYSKFTYGPKQTSADESDSKHVEYSYSESDSSVERTTSMPARVDNAPNIVVIGEAKEILRTKSSITTVDDPHTALKDKEIIDSRRFRHMTGNKARLADYQEFKGGSVAFGCSNGRITGKGKIKAGRLDFEDVYYVEELMHYNLFSVSQICDKKNKFDGKSDSGFLVGYSLNSKDFRVYNLETKRVEENLHVNFLENKPTVVEKGHAWMFDIDYLTNSMNYEPVSLENQASKSAGPKEANNSAGDKIQKTTDCKTYEKPISQVEQIFQEELEKHKRQEKEANDAVRKETTHENQNANTNSTNLLNVVSTPISTAGPLIALNDDEPSYPDDPSMPHLEDIYISPSKGILTDSSYDDEGVVTDFNNLETTVNVSLTLTTRIHTIHPKTQILRDPQTRSKVHKNSEAHALKVWILVDLPFGKKAIGTKWVYRNKKDERGVVVRNKARLVTQGHRQEEGIDYDEVFAPVAKIEAIRIFLAFTFYMGFIVYQMDVKSAFPYGTIDEEVYVTQPPSFVDPKFPNKVYKVVKALYGLHQAPRAWYATLSTFLEKSRYRRGATLFIKQDKKDIMIVQVYVDDIIFGSTKKSWCDEFKELMKNSVKTASTPIKTQKPLVKDEEPTDVDVTPKTSHLQAVKRIFRYLKGQPKLGLWYPQVSSFDLETYSDRDYAATLVKGRLLEVTTAKHSEELASPKHISLGKDESNLLIVHSLLKTIWLSMHHVIAMKHWLFQSIRLLMKLEADLESTMAFELIRFIKAQLEE